MMTMKTSHRSLEEIKMVGCYYITRTVRRSDYSPAVDLSGQKDKLVTENLRV